MLTLPADLTHAHAEACVRSLRPLVRAEKSTALVADASALVRFDSSALAVLLECRREALALGKSFAVYGLSADLRKLASLYGIAGLLPAAS